MGEMIPVNIIIGDRPYRIRIESVDEEHVRATLKLINDKIIEFKTQFAGKDMQDYIAMVLIWYATQPPESNSPALNKALSEGLQKIEEQLDEVLK